MKKTENTPANKARFFALYFLQQVFDHPQHMINKYVCSWNLDGCNNNMKHSFLSLRSISSLTDEELHVISNLLGHKVFVGDRFMRNIVNGAWLYQSIYVAIHITDYLRSIGILIQWMDLSVEDIKAYGWAKEVVHA